MKMARMARHLLNVKVIMIGDILQTICINWLHQNNAYTYHFVSFLQKAVLMEFKIKANMASIVGDLARLAVSR